MENYYVRILTKNMRNVYVEAHRRAMKEYYPPHLTGPGSRGVGLLDMVFFAQVLTSKLSLQSSRHLHLRQSTPTLYQRSTYTLMVQLLEPQNLLDMVSLWSIQMEQKKH